MLDINSLPHVSELEDIDTNFRVFAGPGAGKTTWLIQHIIKILKTSCRLHKTRKIALYNIHECCRRRSNEQA